MLFSILVSGSNMASGTVIRNPQVYDLTINVCNHNEKKLLIKYFYIFKLNILYEYPSMMYLK